MDLRHGILHLTKNCDISAVTEEYYYAGSAIASKTSPSMTAIG